MKHSLFCVFAARVYNYCMQPLTTELVSKTSPNWLGFSHFFKSIIFGFISMFVLIIVGLGFPDLFGFYFATFWQTMRLLFLSTLLGVGLSAFLTNKRQGDPDKILWISMTWFIGSQLIILATLFWGDQTPHYGVTNRDQFYEQIPLSVMMLAEFYFVSKIFLKNAAPKIPT